MRQARFTFRRRPWVSLRPRSTFGNSSLGLLETPWPNGTTGDLLGRMEWHRGLAGNAYVTNRTPGRLRILRPDWVQILYGSDLNPDEAAYALDGEVVAYLYTVGGPNSTNKPTALLPHEVCHWAPDADPEGAGIGMSWFTPAIRDVQVDRATTDHKLAFFTQGATPNMVVKGLKATNQKQFDDMVDALEREHRGLGNAYKTLYLGEGADATVVGSNFTEMALRAVQDGGETRISVLSRVPAALLGISEGLRGSALNESSFAMARRVFADTWLTDSLQNLCGSLAPLVNVPVGSELWFDTTDIPLLREDGKDQAAIELQKQQMIVAYTNAGFTAKSAVTAVDTQDVSQLVHTDLLSVQLQPPGSVLPTAPSNGNGAKPPMSLNGVHVDPEPVIPAPVIRFPRRTRRTVERDQAGDITAVIEEVVD
jgi:phage portal protein BeeE